MRKEKEKDATKMYKIYIILLCLIAFIVVPAIIFSIYILRRVDETFNKLLGRNPLISQMLISFITGTFIVTFLSRSITIGVVFGFILSIILVISNNPDNLIAKTTESIYNFSTSFYINVALIGIAVSSVVLLAFYALYIFIKHIFPTDSLLFGNLRETALNTTPFWLYKENELLGFVDIMFHAISSNLVRRSNKLKDFSTYLRTRKRTVRDKVRSLGFSYDDEECKLGTITETIPVNNMKMCPIGYIQVSSKECEKYITKQICTDKNENTKSPKERLISYVKAQNETFGK